MKGAKENDRIRERRRGEEAIGRKMRRREGNVSGRG